MPMRILIVDDHPIVASGCRALLAGDPDIGILEASDADSGEEAFVTERPDICVLDINLPGVSGFELARRILTRDGAARIIMFSMNDDPIFAARAIETGAKGYVSKSGDPEIWSQPFARWARAGYFCRQRSLKASHLPARD
jgi:two-component system invasion response regulator UvrY